MLFFFAIFVNKYSTKRCTEIPCYFCSFCYSFQLAVLDIQVLITSNNFHRLCLFTFCNANLRSKHKYQCFFILVQIKDSVLVHFQGSMHWLFPIQNLISLVIHIFPFKWCPGKKPKQNSSKTKQHSQQQEANRVRWQTAISQQNFFWLVTTGTLRWLASLHCPLYFLAFDWLRPAVLFFLNWTVCLFVKESPVWNYLN